jgi:hypothetical protein
MICSRRLKGVIFCLTPKGSVIHHPLAWPKGYLTAQRIGLSTTVMRACLHFIEYEALFHKTSFIFECVWWYCVPIPRVAHLYWIKV